MTTHLISMPPEKFAPRDEPLAFASDPSNLPGSVAQQAPAARAPRGRLRLGAAWVIFGRSLGIGVTMLVNIALARWLTPEEFGSFLLLSSVLALATLLAMLGLDAAIVRFVPESLGKGDVARARHAMTLVLGMATVTISGVAALAALVLAYFDATLLGLPAVPGLVPMAVTGLVLLAVIQLSAEACRSLHELRLASLFSGGQTGGLLSNILFLTLIAAAMVLGKPSFMTAVALNLVAMCVSLPFALFALSRAARECLGTIEPRRTSSTLTVRQLLAFSLPMLLIQLLTFATAQGDLWIAGICCPHDQLALYGASRRLTLLVTMPLQMLNLTVISSIAELYGQGRHRDLERLLRGAASLAAWPSLGVIALLIVAGGPIMEMLFGPYFRQAALPLGILAVGQLFLVCAGSSSCVLAMTGHQMGSLFVNLATALALVTIGTLAARHFGIVGLAVTSTGIITAQSISLWLLAKKFAGVWTHPALRPSLPSN